MITKIAEAAEAAEAAEVAKAEKKMHPDHAALVDKYIAQYPAAQSIRGQLIAKKMDSGKVADAVRELMDGKLGA